MKKILVSLLVLALCAPAMAATTITVTEGTGGDAGKAIVTIDSTGDAVNMVGLGLDVDVTAGGVTAVEIVTANFNIYPDYAYTQEIGDGYTYGEGEAEVDGPVAEKLTPGHLALPSDSFALSFGNLNGAATAGATGADTVVVKLTLSETADVTVCENATRGGIVDINGIGLVAACDTETINVGAAECMKATHPDYATWVTYGMPDCWCYSKQCKGDIDGKAQFGGAVDVYTDDTNILLPAFGAGVITSVPGVCADVDHGTQFGGAVNVYTNDLSILLPNFGAGVLTDCDMTHFNFWITPSP